MRHAYPIILGITKVMTIRRSTDCTSLGLAVEELVEHNKTYEA